MVAVDNLDIDIYLYHLYDSSMATRTRPERCCEYVVPPVAVSDELKQGWLGYFRALSEPTRLDIMFLLAAQNAPLCACDIGDQFELSQPTISHHMRVLTNSGLVVATKQGVWAYYELSEEGRGVMEGMLVGHTAGPMINAG